MKDLNKYRDMPDVLHRNPQFFTTYPELVNRAHDDHRRRRRQEDQGARDRVSFRKSRRSPAWWRRVQNLEGIPMSTVTVNVEEKLFQNRYRSTRPAHIRSRARTSA
jgi:hypothetical protein